MISIKKEVFTSHVKSFKLQLIVELSSKLDIMKIDEHSTIKMMNKNILREMGKIYRGLNSFTDILVKPLGLDKGQYQYLVRVGESPGINQKNLSQILLVDKTTCAKAINKLITKGFISKSRDKLDKRNYKLNLTTQGLEIRNFLIKEEEFTVAKCLKGFKEKDTTRLEQELVEIRKNVEIIFSDIKENKNNFDMTLFKSGKY